MQKTGISRSLTKAGSQIYSSEEYKRKDFMIKKNPTKKYPSYPSNPVEAVKQKSSPSTNLSSSNVLPKKEPTNPPENVAPKPETKSPEKPVKPLAVKGSIQQRAQRTRNLRLASVNSSLPDRKKGVVEVKKPLEKPTPSQTVNEGQKPSQPSQQSLASQKEALQARLTALKAESSSLGASLAEKKETQHRLSDSLHGVLSSLNQAREQLSSAEENHQSLRRISADIEESRNGFGRRVGQLRENLLTQVNQLKTHVNNRILEMEAQREQRRALEREQEERERGAEERNRRRQQERERLFGQFMGEETDAPTMTASNAQTGPGDNSEIPAFLRAGPGAGGRTRFDFMPGVQLMAG